jgi:hypothetical protein
MSVVTERSNAINPHGFEQYRLTVAREVLSGLEVQLGTF